MLPFSNGVQAQIDYLIGELSRKDMPTAEMDILKEFFTRLQQDYQTTVEGKPCSVYDQIYTLCVNWSWERSIFLSK